MGNKKFYKKTEFILLFVIAVLVIFIQARSGQFFTANNIVDISRSFIVPAMFSLGAMMVIVSGGFDVSMPAIASFTMFILSKYLVGENVPIIVYFLLAIGMGIGMGALNGFLVAKFEFQPLIVTLGTSSVFTGILLGVFNAREIVVPTAMLDLGRSVLFTGRNQESNLTSDMPYHFLFVIVIIVLIWFILNKTMLGRSIYAIGGDAISAKRVGFRVFRSRMFLYCFVGALAGFAGISRASMMLSAQPTNMAGMELNAIAACVLGGVSVTGGRGSIMGALLGTALITILTNSLILLGVSSYWTKIFTGAVIIIGTGITAYQALKNSKQLAVKTDHQQAAQAKG